MNVLPVVSLALCSFMLASEGFLFTQKSKPCGGFYDCGAHGDCKSGFFVHLRYWCECHPGYEGIECGKTSTTTTTASTDDTTQHHSAADS